MLTYQPAANTWKVSDGVPVLLAIADRTGAMLVVFPDESEELVPADETESFLRICQHSESFEEICDWMGWKR